MVNIVQEAGNTVGLITEALTSMQVSVHEDNINVLVLAETIPPWCTPRSKYYVIKTVWRCKENIKQGVRMHNNDTFEKLGGVLTRGLQRPRCEYIIKEMIGW